MIVWVKNKRKRRTGNGKPLDTQHHVQSRLDECRRHKLSGDYIGFYRTLKDIAEIIAYNDHALRETINSGLEQVQFGAQSPDSAQTDRLLRDIERKTADFYNLKNTRQDTLKKYRSQKLRE